ncbi:hypothetical protein Enr13x_28010 [Stieleria neptunia]|uniref:Uncharacterized protein n=1 Tax=Stieleria neptunia TaxID=2527979 RepID=A0A518HQ31_9BACT|nr:hypothetical protein [Stieleria neptunia]QDV42949.1 hypothetical protein Enr13x_28010 [Stieleria neptunia]
MTNHPNPMAGILSVGDAAEMLGANPIDVQRVIALGELDDNRNKDGNVVMRGDLERFMGRRAPNLKSLRTRDGWFAHDPTLVQRDEFQRRIRRHAGELAQVTDEQIDAAYKANPRQRPLTFTVAPTKSMRDCFAADSTGTLFARKPSGVPLGVSAMAAVLRDGALREVNRRLGRRGMSKGGVGSRHALETLYESPEAFKGIAEAAKSALTALDVAFHESRKPASAPGEVSILTTVKLSSLSTNFDHHVAMAVDLAF